MYTHNTHTLFGILTDVKLIVQFENENNGRGLYVLYYLASFYMGRCVGIVLYAFANTYD